MAKENRPLMRRQKGWIGYCRTHHIYAQKHDDVNWGEGTKKPKDTSKDVMGKEVQKW
jgi:hypothetical protein